MIQFAIPTGGVGPTLSYLDPPLGAGAQPTATDSNHIITRNGQYFPLSDQGTDGLNSFYLNVPLCNSTPAHNTRLWYERFVQHASMCGLYIHPYFCVRTGANFLTGFTYGFDIVTPLVQYDLPSHFQPWLQDRLGQLYLHYYL